MNIEIKNYSFPSHTGLCDIYAQKLVPENSGAIKGVVQLSHGMAEYSDRYDRFAKTLCEHGYAVFKSDHAGHGKSVSDKKMLGFFGAEDGDENWVKDLKEVADIAKSEYPDLPFFLFGHGMGSLIARKYTAQHASIFKGVVYSGTSGKNPAVGVGILLADIFTWLHGPEYKSKILDKIAFGAYNKKTEKKTPCDWASRDEIEVRKFIEDEYCGYMYSVSGLKALFMTLKAVSSDKWYADIPSKLPIFLVSGSMDPIGGYSKGVKEVYEKLGKTGHTAVSMKIYKDARHEILNEINRDEVTADIISWLDKNI